MQLSGQHLPPPTTCLCCDGVIPEAQSVSCDAGHKLCAACFENSVSTLVMVNEDSKIQFLKSGCQDTCQYCLPAICVYDMQKCGPFLTQRMFTAYMELLTEARCAKSQKDLEERLRQSNRELAILKAANPEEARLEALCEDIADACIQPRCPNQECNKFFADFDACCALQCSSCRQWFCGWCLVVFPGEKEVHNHVPECLFNPPCNRGNLYPPQPHPQLWNNVMHEFARKRVKDRISTITSIDQQKQVHKMMQAKYPEIRLPDFGIVQSDGVRHRYERGANFQFETNVTLLLEMELADRPRAVQALEIHHNNLEEATAFLLAARRQQ